jgi:hypothetical protein
MRVIPILSCDDSPEGSLKSKKALGRLIGVKALKRLLSSNRRNLDWTDEQGQIKGCRIYGGVLVSTLQVRQRRHAEDGSLASLILEPNVNC